MFTARVGAHRCCSREEDGDGEGRRGSRTRRRRAEKAPVALLLHFPASARPTEAERGGATLVQELRRQCWLRRMRASGEKRGCLGACWGWGAFDRVLGGGFYRPGSRGRGWPEGGRCGGPGDVRWATPGAAALRACWQGSILASGHCGQALARPRRSAACRDEEGEERGSGRCPPFSSLSHGPGRGWGGWARQRECPRHGYRARANGNSVVHSERGFSEILPPRCSIKCPQEFKFRILTATGVCQDTSQGFQIYFC
jgi:hypothetical protein